MILKNGKRIDGCSDTIVIDDDIETSAYCPVWVTHTKTTD